ncbi:hypothetical protein [Pedobacter cryoconitis]|uniref:hypothetical protein n=1 Tax=Pedobacter cryoconitis TaxID=188932 RepID=UPI000AC496E9|nr:hypothetical protein [Pedobacter cryoconitis]
MDSTCSYLGLTLTSTRPVLRQYPDDTGSLGADQSHLGFKYSALIWDYHQPKSSFTGKL